MRKFTVFVLLCVILLGCFAGCKNNEVETSIVERLSGDIDFLEYSTGFDAYGNYNNKLYSYNQMDAIGGDPGAIFVPKERNAEYGGYYYVYVTGGLKQLFGWDSDNYLTGYDDDVETLAVKCYRSKDLCSWEMCGSERGYTIIGREGDWEEWTLRVPCAPEVVYNAKESKYYMYYNMISRLRDDGELKRRDGETPAADKAQYPRSGRNYIGIATSDNPCGPFTPLSRTETVMVDGEPVLQSVPCINFEKEWNLSSLFPLEDISPFLDDDGSLYLYVKSPNNGCIYGVKMDDDDWTKPLYDTFVCVLRKGYNNIESPTGKDAANPDNLVCSGTISEQLIEGPNMLKHNGQYYLTFSMGDYLKQGYAVYQSKGLSPLGKFHRVGEGTGLPVVSGINTNNFTGTGHHCFVYDGKEWFNVYHAHQNIQSFGWDRYVHADRVLFKEFNGETVIVTNGPSRSLQWLPEQVAEYTNIASKAKITAIGGSGEEFLNDGMIPFYDYNADCVFSSDEDVVITLTFDSPVSIVSVMIFNSFSELSAFSEIKAIAFELAEKSEWMTKKYDYAAIIGLKFPNLYFDENGIDSFMYKNCAPAVAEFMEIKVKSITIAIEKGARIKDYDKLGNENTSLNLTEIAVLGKEI